MIGAGCDKGKDGGEEGKSASRAAAPGSLGGKGRDAGLGRLAPRVVWNTPYAGRVRVLTVASGVVVAISRDRRDRSSARRIAGLSVTDGRLLWQRTTRVRLFERNAPWTTSFAVVGDTLAVAKTADRVEGFDVKSGVKRWQTKATGGVVRVGDQLALAHRDHVRLVAPATGKEQSRMSLADPRSGAPGNGLMERFKPGTRMAKLPGGLLVSRHPGAGLQALQAADLTSRWLAPLRGAVPKRPDRFAVGERTLLVPVHYASRQEQTRLSVWPAGKKAQAPQWTATIPGRASRKRVWVTPEHVLGLSRTRTRQKLLWRVERKTGRLVDARPFPRFHFCYYEDGTMACKRKRSVGGHRVDTLARRWRYEPKRGNILSVRKAGKLLVMEVGKTLLVKRLTDGETVMTVPRSFEKHRFRVVEALGVTKKRLVLAARHLEGSAHGDRLLLLAFDLNTGKPVYHRRLGRFPKPRNRWAGPVTEPEREGHLPVLWARATAELPARVYSLFDETFQVLDAATGRSRFARGVPGEKDERARLLERFGDRAVFRRGRRAFAVELQGHRIRWQASLWRVRLEHVAPHRLYVSKWQRRDRKWQAVPPQAPDPEAAGLQTRAKKDCSLRWATSKRWLCQDREHLLVMDPTTGKVAHQGPKATNVFRQGPLLLATHASRERAAKPDQWLGLSVRTGELRWKHPGGEAESAPLPLPLEREQARPARWAAAAAGAFLVTGAEGRCVYAVDQDTGKRRFRRCFGELSGPPVSWRGVLLLAARPPGPQGRPTPEQDLYRLDGRTGEARSVFRPGSGKRVVLGEAPVHQGVLYLTVRPAKGGHRRNEILALKLR